MYIREIREKEQVRRVENRERTGFLKYCRVPFSSTSGSDVTVKEIHTTFLLFLLLSLFFLFLSPVLSIDIKAPSSKRPYTIGTRMRKHMEAIERSLQELR